MTPPSSSTSKSSILSRVTPSNHEIFDPWNSASTGHQRAENPYSNTTAWRDTRTQKLSRQFRGVPIDANVSSDSGASISSKKRSGEWRWLSAEEARRNELGCHDIRSFMGGSKKRKVGETDLIEGKEKTRTGVGHDEGTSAETADTRVGSEIDAATVVPGAESVDTAIATSSVPSSESQSQQTGEKSATGIFTGTTIYINGSTMPLISDHKLKHMLAAHGGQIAIGLAHRTVTHVVVGTPNNARVPGAGAGGGLAAGKLQKEIEKLGGKGVRFVGVEWVLESIKAGKRLSEAKFAPLHMASKGQRSVMGMFKSASSAGGGR